MDIYVNISILIDETTSLSCKLTLIVYINAALPFIFRLDEISDQKADTILKTLIDCLNEHGRTEDYLQQNFVAFTSDGASTMLGQQSGVAKQLLEKFPDIVWHCLDVSDPVDEVCGVNNLKYLWINYIHKCAAELDHQQSGKIGCILNTRCVASSFRTVSAVWQGYSVLFAKDDVRRSSTDRNMYNESLKCLLSRQFILVLAIMYDALAELAMLSATLQNRGTTVVYADIFIQRIIRFIESLKEKAGTRLECLRLK
ncbi:hypothetical protein PR048_009929 [Dryococelus australis]|uniref:DUF4371 domain-containing protein n=1 Tax=Dryococelus australis TaxID=614101 RepID=A0ABQ9I222_9NEOP|nr:hypothetical protein PR048_009929 [Dryococelus australis]